MAPRPAKLFRVRGKPKETPPEASGNFPRISASPKRLLQVSKLAPAFVALASERHALHGRAKGGGGGLFRCLSRKSWETTALRSRLWFTTRNDRDHESPRTSRNLQPHQNPSTRTSGSQDIGVGTASPKNGDGPQATGPNKNLLRNSEKATRLSLQRSAFQLGWALLVATNRIRERVRSLSERGCTSRNNEK